MNQIVYIGPTIRGLVKKNQIFTYEPKDIIEKSQKISMYAGYLFVGMNDIVSKRNELRKQGTLLNISYNIVKKEVANV